MEEAERARDRCLLGESPAAAGGACYRRGEIHRLRGGFAAAERAYREASGFGFEPQPGFAFLRLAEGKTDAAEAAIRRVEGETTEPGKHVGVLPAYVEIMVAANDLAAAEAGCAELESLANDFGSESVDAVTREARGRLELARGAPGLALRNLRAAAEAWRELDAPYELARTRELVGVACRELGDEDSAKLELDAAAKAFAGLGAPTDLARVGMLAEIASAVDSHGLTQRELEVLRHVAGGATNKAIAAELVLSVRTVDRARQQHLREARRLLAGCGDRIRNRARPDLSRLSELPIRAATRSWVIQPMRPASRRYNVAPGSADHDEEGADAEHHRGTP